MIESKMTEEEKQKDASAACMIYQGNAEEIFPLIMGAQTAKEA